MMKCRLVSLWLIATGLAHRLYGCGQYGSHRRGWTVRFGIKWLRYLDGDGWQAQKGGAKIVMGQDR